MLYQKELQIKYDVDILIAGGGAAGVAAALSTARDGKSVFLAEAMGCFGGLGTSGLVPAFAPFTDGVNTLCDGVGKEIRDAVSVEPIDTYWTVIDAEKLKLVYDKLLTEAGVSFSFFTTVTDAVVENDKINYVVLNAKSGTFAAKAKIYIDCTGDGDLCALAGGAFEQGDESGQVMPATLCSTWVGADFNQIDRTVSDNAFIEDAYRAGILSVCDRHLPGMFNRPDGISGGNVGHIFDMNPTDEVSVTEGMLRARKSLQEYQNYYRTYVKGYENVQMITTAAIPGIRESRRITCDYTLGLDDFINRATFPDEIGRYCYPIDIHVKNTSAEEYKRFTEEYEQNMRYKAGESYGIPYRSLIPVSFSNVLVAGRCMGCDQKMQASIRVMPGCFITGQAAGVAASLAADTGDVRSISVETLQDKLKEANAYLPNRK